MPADYHDRVMKKYLAPIAAAALAGSVLLTGCQQDSSVAARVGDEVISVDDVDLLAQPLCDVRARLVASGQAEPVTRAALREASLWALVSSQQATQFGEANGIEVDNKAVNSSVASYEPLFKAVDEDDRARLTNLIRTVVIGQHQFAAVAGDVLGPQAAQGDPNALVDQVRTTLQKKGELAQVKVNPVFESSARAAFGVGDDSVSHAVSDAAKAKQSPNEADMSPEKLGAMPSSLRCG